MNSDTPSRQVIFDPTPEIFASDSGGRFHYPLVSGGDRRIETAVYDEIRFVLSIWHPASGRTIDLDRAYVELTGCLDPEEEHWIKLVEIEPVVPPYNAGESFDGWIVLPILGAESSFAINGSGFEPRARVQIRASAYLVS